MEADRSARPERQSLPGDGNRPRLRLEVSQAQRPLLGDFSPLATPKELGISFGDTSVTLLERLRAGVALELRAGRYLLSVFEEEPLPAEVLPDCTCHLVLAAGAPDEEESDQRMVTAVELAFDKPLILRNILSILARLQSRFQDYEVTDIINRLTQAVADQTGITDLKAFGRVLAGRLATFVADWLPPGLAREFHPDKWKGTAGALVQEAATVRLERISGRPVRRGNRWFLELRFTGEWDLMGQVRIPFHHVRVHRAILPAPHALIERLFSEQPLATAGLRGSSLPALDLAQQLGTMVKSLRGRLTARAASPDLSLRVGMADEGALNIDTRPLGTFEVESAFHGQVDPNRLTLQVEHLDVLCGDHRLRAEGGFEGWTGGELESPGYADTAIGRCLESLISGEWSSQKLAFSVFANVSPESAFADADVRARYTHPLLLGGTDVRLALRNIGLDGEVAARFGQSASGLEAQRVDVRFACDAALEPGSLVDTGRTRIRPRIAGTHLAGTFRAEEPGHYALRLAGSTPLEIRTETDVAAFPELGLDDCVATAEVRCDLALDGVLRMVERGRSPFEMDFKGTTARVRVAEARIEADGRTLRIPPGSRFVASLEDGVLAASGLGRAAVRVGWDLLGTSPVLHHKERYVMLFVLPLCQGDLTLHVSPAGGVSISGPEGGLYDARFFNALINPADELQRWLDILDSDEALDRVFATLEVFSPDAVVWLRRIRTFVRRAQTILDEEGIAQPADAIPAPRIARLLARLVFDDPAREEALYPLVKQVVDGEGLNVTGVKRLVNERWPDHEWEFEVDRLLRLAARVLGPAAPVPPVQVREGIPLAEDPKYRDRHRDLPDAATLYATVDSSEPLPVSFSARVARVAPYLGLAQLTYLVGKGRTDWQAADLARIKHVRELKQRARDISQGYGGVAFAPQAMAIAFFLADTIRLSRQQRTTLRTGPRDFAAEAAQLRERSLVPDVLLGPDDVAVLLHAGLASAWAGRAVQLNQRMLLELVLEQPASFLRDVLVELGRSDPRVLGAALNALLDMPQHAMARPLDLPALLSQRMGFEFPRLSDFLAGGRRANHSYYEALANTADQVLSLAEPYRALRFTLQEYRHEVPKPERRTARRRQLFERFEKAIAAADRAGRRCPFDGKGGLAEERAKNAYRKAFDAGTELLDTWPRAFQQPLFKAFWARNHEALTLLSVVRNVQEDIDQTRHWLRVRSGKAVPRGEQKLLETVIDALYYFPQDRESLRADPLVRLLIDPPEGRYDFTLVSAMGVITGGAKGTELEEAYGRLESRRGVRVVRADTATGRSLEFNAGRIIDALRDVETPWGYVGYSQGCANGLMAENLLMAGTPEQRKLVERLVCRNLLFSAFNASAHGTCGDEKFLDAMVYLDHFLAHYQSRLSSRAIQTALRSMRVGLDSQSAVLYMLGSRSLATWGVMGLHLGGQFKSDVPTTIMRGVVEPETLPEALEWLANVLSRQVEHDHHDTQVTIRDAQGHSILAKTPQLELLEACDMGCMVQRTHHWSPLRKDTEFVTTDRDRERAIYEVPKDRHVFPWLDVNARFGRIRTT